jgi:DNA-binding beta-propeller fold protein YncE
VEGRFDHMAIDLAAQRLFVAALGNNSLEVLDTAKNAHSSSRPGFSEPQGVAFVADARQVAVANGAGGTLQLIDAANYQVVRTLAVGDDADNVRYDGAAKRVYVGYASGALAAVNASNGTVLATVKLAGHPESFQLERSGPLIYVNVPTARHIAVVDRTTMKVTATWPVTAAASNYPMALDEAGHRVYVGCRRPAKVLVYDTTTGKQTGAFDVVGDTDDLFYDSTRKRLYVSGGEGFIDVIQQQNGNTYTRLARVTTAAGARTSLYVPDQNRLYLAVPHRGAQKAQVRVFEAH